MKKATSIRSILRADLERSGFFATSYREVREIFRLYWSHLKKTPHGFLFSGNPSMEAGAFQMFETMVVRALLAELDAVVNVGTNMGYYV